MKINKNAFTLAETLIVLVILGVLAVFLLSSLSKANPDRIKTMFKKSYSVAERTIGELVNDESLYPYAGLDNIGFLNTSQVDLPGGDTAGGARGGAAARQKFCKLFSRKLNIIGNVQYGVQKTRLGRITAKNGVALYSGNSCFFTTSDGVDWLLPTNATTTAANYPLAIYVDVDGHDKGPNSNADSEERDIFTILFEADGRVTVPAGGKEVEYLKSHNINKD